MVRRSVAVSDTEEKFYHEYIYKDDKTILVLFKTAGYELNK